MSGNRAGVFEGWPLVGWAALAVALAAAAGFALHGTEAEGWRQLIRATARISGVLLLATFLARPLRRLSRSGATAWLLRNRRPLGVGVGVSHAVHGYAIYMYMQRSEFEPDPFTLVAAGIAYLFLAAMVATSFDVTAARLGRNAWRKLHTAGVWYLWFIFGFTFFGSAMAGDAIAAAFTGAFVLAMPLRLYGLRAGATSDRKRA